MILAVYSYILRFRAIFVMQIRFMNSNCNGFNSLTVAQKVNSWTAILTKPVKLVSMVWRLVKPAKTTMLLVRKINALYLTFYKATGLRPEISFILSSLQINDLMYFIECFLRVVQMFFFLLMSTEQQVSAPSTFTFS